MPPINFRPVELRHFTEDGIAEFQLMWFEAIQQINNLTGVNGPIQVLNNINLNGNRVTGSGVAQSPTDLLSQNAADPKYSTAVQQAAMEAVGTKMLQTTRRLNDGKQQHALSSDLNSQGSIPPSNVIGSIPYTTVAGSSITFTWSGIYVQLADLSYTTVANGTLTVTGLANATYSIYPYLDTKTGLLTFVAIAGTGVGAPPIAFTAPNTNAAQQQTADTRIALTSGPESVTINGNPGSVGLRSR